MFSTLSKTEMTNFVTFNLSSANAFNLIWSKILSSGNGLKTKFLDASKLKMIPDDKLYMTQIVESVSERLKKHNVGKGETASYQHFLLFSQCF